MEVIHNLSCSLYTWKQCKHVSMYSVFLTPPAPMMGRSL